MGDDIRRVCLISFLALSLIPSTPTTRILVWQRSTQAERARKLQRLAKNEAITLALDLEDMGKSMSTALKAMRASLVPFLVKLETVSRETEWQVDAALSAAHVQRERRNSRRVSLGTAGRAMRNPRVAHAIDPRTSNNEAAVVELNIDRDSVDGEGADVGENVESDADDEGGVGARGARKMVGGDPESDIVGLKSGTKTSASRDAREAERALLDAVQDLHDRLERALAALQRTQGKVDRVCSLAVSTGSGASLGWGSAALSCDLRAALANARAAFRDLLAGAGGSYSQLGRTPTSNEFASGASAPGMSP